MAKSSKKAAKKPARDLTKVKPGDPNRERGTWANKRLAGPKGPETTMMSCPRCGIQRSPVVEANVVANKCRCENPKLGGSPLEPITLVDFVPPSDKPAPAAKPSADGADG